MQNKNYIYLVENQIQFYNKKEDKYYYYELSKKILENGKIIHRPKFLREFKTFLKKNHIIRKFQKNILYFIIPPTFNEIDKEIIKKIFDELSFHEIKFLKELNIYKMKKNVLWVNLNDNYMFLNYLLKHNKESIILKNNYLNLNLLDQLIIFLNNNKNIKKIYLFGTNHEIASFSEKIENKIKCIVLYFEESYNYILKQNVKHNKK